MHRSATLHTAGALPQHAPACDFGRPIAAAECDIRVMTAGKADAAALAWLGAWLEPVAPLTWDPGDGVAPDLAGSFQALVVCGSDHARLEQLASALRPALQDTPLLIAISQHTADPCLVAALLRAGADDVVALETSPAEAAARTRALVRRARSHSDAQVREPEPPIAVRLIPGTRFDPAEIAILRVLEARPGSAATYDELLLALGREPAKAALPNLRARISRLRAKLPATMAIYNMRNTGYELASQLVLLSGRPALG